MTEPSSSSSTLLQKLSQLKQYFSLTRLFFNKVTVEDYTYEKILSMLTHYNKSKEDNNISEHYLINNIMSLRGKRAQDIMIPRVDIIALKHDSDIDSILKLTKNHGYSRFPVYQENLDDVIGFIHIKDMLPILKKKNNLVMQNILRQIMFVSPYMKIFDLLYEMRTKRLHMAIVVDEFGGVDGLITIEDVMEEIVGEITDEYDKAPVKMIQVIDANTLEVDARVELEDLESYVGKRFTTTEYEEYNTIAGLIVALVGNIPAKNELIVHESGLEFRILSVDPVKINKICVYYD